MISKEKKAEIIAAYGRTPEDTGSFVRAAIPRLHSAMGCDILLNRIVIKSHLWPNMGILLYRSISYTGLW